MLLASTGILVQILRAESKVYARNLATRASSFAVYGQQETVGNSAGLVNQSWQKATASQ